MKEAQVPANIDKVAYVKELFPELQEIADLDIRRKVVDCWLIPLEESQ